MYKYHDVDKIAQCSTLKFRFFGEEVSVLLVAKIWISWRFDRLKYLLSALWSTETAALPKKRFSCRSNCDNKIIGGLFWRRVGRSIDPTVFYRTENVFQWHRVISVYSPFSKFTFNVYLFSFWSILFIALLVCANPIEIVFFSFSSGLSKFFNTNQWFQS